MIAFSKQLSPSVQSVLSTEDFIVRCDDELTGQSLDPAGLTVDFQLVNGGLPPRAQPTSTPAPPKSTGWVAGNFVTNTNNVCFAQVSIGPDGQISVPSGRYAVWVKSGEQVQTVGQIRVE